MTNMVYHGVDIPEDKIAAFCRKWRITEFALFGSVLRPDFRPDSDIDVLITVSRDALWSFWDLDDLSDELRQLLGREVDVVSKRALKNPFRRHEILTTRRVIYAA